MPKPAPLTDAATASAAKPPPKGVAGAKAQAHVGKVRNYYAGLLQAVAWLGIPLAYMVMTMHPSIPVPTFGAVSRDGYEQWRWWLTLATLLAAGIGSFGLALSTSQPRPRRAVFLYAACMLALLLVIDLAFGCDLGDCSYP